jgi:mono/diheme cytochrome c family protein
LEKLDGANLARYTSVVSTKSFHGLLCVVLLPRVMLGTAGVDVSKLPTTASSAVDFARDIQPIFTVNCFKCHGPEKQKGGLRLDVKEAALRGGDNYAPVIRPGKSAESPLIHFVAGLVDDMVMPQKGGRLSSEQIGLLRAWIDQGAEWPDDGKAKALHWSLKPVMRPAVPEIRNPKSEIRNPIDAFILARLQAEKLTLSPGADRRTLIRRLSFDLIGLPPTPEETSAFLADKSSNAYERLVERSLASPRYGERWARHWLDVVRFAETTGFEVNTPRNNAWPYRDYVIRAFNDDKPYDQFIREQLAGDLFGADAATGFLVGGANDQVKSPDVVLTSQQRADELHDMVATTGSTFLGLTIGCARCHNHKFDPIPQTDYYAVKAVFAGVQHGERPHKTPGYEERLKEAGQLRQLATRVEGELVQFEPLANPLATNQPAPNPRLNEEKFPPTMAKFVRFTIYETGDNLNPCLDELEVFTVGASSTNVALAGNGTKATASGTYPNSEIHRLEHINDGKFGNSHSWISSEPGKGWVQLEFPAPVMVDRIVWGRDREENFKDRLATSYEIEIGEDAKALRRVAGQAPARPAVNPRLNVERFAPVVAKRLRFTISETTGAEPCIDELEVFAVGQGNQPARNVALAGAGTKATASGTYPNSEIHRLEHINDGQVGNSRSWISSEAGKGWVELEFPEAVTINKVAWGRDREEKFKDRLATNYKIEVASGTNAWQVIASAADRRKYKPDEKFKPTYRTADLTEAEAARLSELLAERAQREAKIQELTAAPMIYGGTFTKPEVTYRQHRGDPMQPREVIEPGALEAVPVKFDLSVTSSPTTSPTEEQCRRLALANWMADANNPLTARVMVNRVWQHHFGQGLVATPSDFGANGAKPSHPELLDWLASEFVARGWSVKALHRLIVTSAAYRQAGTERPEGLAHDAAAKWLWRFPPRRLEAEPIRDAILAVSGKLDLKAGGPGYSVFEPNDNYVRVYNARQEFGPDGWRRMIYMTKVRMQQDATFGAFDCPDGGQIAPKRTSSTTPLQALNLLNSGFLMQQAGFFAERLQRESRGDVAAQVRRAFELAFNRPPKTKEAAVAKKFVEQEGLTIFCRALLNANEFVYVF